MPRQSYAEYVNSAKLMISGLRENKEKLAKRGFDDVFIESLVAAHTSVTELDNQQESLKARLKEKTVELESAMNDMKKLLSESRKIVKIDIPKETWPEFGISDKQ